MLHSHLSLKPIMSSYKRIKGFQSNICNPESLRDAIMSVKTKQMSPRNASLKHGVSTRNIQTALNALKQYEDNRGAPLVESSNSRQLYRWASDYARVNKNKNKLAYTEEELSQAVFNLLSGDAKTSKDATRDLGIPRRSLHRSVASTLLILQLPSFKVCQKMVKQKKISREKIRTVVDNRNKTVMGRPTHLNRDEEALVVAVAEIKGAHSLPQTRKLLAENLHKLLQTMGKRTDEVDHKTKQAYARSVIQRVNKREPEKVGQKKRSAAGEVKVRGLSNKRAKQSDPRLQWIMFHKMVLMYRHVIDEEMKNADKLIQSRCVTNDDEDPPPPAQDVANSLLLLATASSASPKKKQMRCKQEITKEEASKTLEELMVIPKDLAEIQPRDSQVWNCDEIGLDPNGKWTKVVCTYKWCPREEMWKAQTGERAPFWVTLLLFTRADGQCFIPPVVIHQAAELTAEHCLHIPSDWIVHATKSGYMDRDGWFKAMRQFVKLSGAHGTNINVLTFDGHDSHWDSDALDYAADNFVQTFFLKAGDSTTDQPNDNGFNARCKSIYNEEKSKWDQKLLTTRYTPSMMNQVLVATWKRLKVDSGHVIINSYEKTNLVPLKPPSKAEFAGHACVASMQCGTGKKSMELESVKADVFGTEKLMQERTTDEMVIIKSRNSLSRNLLVRAAAYDAVHHSTVIPAQKLKDMQQEIERAKPIKLGAAADVRESRKNPDTSSGLFVTAELRAKARRVDHLRQKDKQDAQEKAVRTAEKNAALAKKKEEAFKRIVDTITKQEGDIHRGLTSHSPKTDIKLAFQHCGGQLKDCKDGSYQTFIDAIMANYLDAFRAGIQHTRNSSSTDPSTNDVSDTSNVRTDVCEPYTPYEELEEECFSTDEVIVGVEV